MGKSVLFFVLLGAMVSGACHERITVYPPPPPTEITLPQAGPLSPPKEPEPIRIETPTIAKKPPTLSRLDVGMIHFHQGNYPEAIEDYKAHLDDEHQAGLKDRALYYLGLSYALSTGPARNLAGAKTSLSRIVKEFPESDYRSQAELILRLIARSDQLTSGLKAREAKIRELQDELDRLKEIDLKRRPSRPTEQ